MSHPLWYTTSMKRSDWLNVLRTRDRIRDKMKNNHQMPYRLAKRGETQTPYYGVWTPEEYDGDSEFPKSHKGLEEAIQLANAFESFVVAHNADCTTETVWTHSELSAAIEKDRCDYYRKGTYHGD